MVKRNNLSNELIDCILEHLYSDIATLLNCALVGRAWVYPSQRGIFHRISLKVDLSCFSGRVSANARIRANTTIFTLFSEKPHLASYVRVLELHDSGMLIMEELLNAVVNVVQCLSSVKKLVLAGIRWSLLSSSLGMAIIDVLRGTSLTHATLDRISIPAFADLASLLSHCTIHLKVLQVGVRCDIWDAPDSSITEAGTSPRSIELDELHLLYKNSIPSFITWFQQDSCPFKVRNLQLLHFGPYVPLGLKAASLLQHVGKNLRVLKMGFRQGVSTLGLL